MDAIGDNKISQIFVEKTCGLASLALEISHVASIRDRLH